ncbi:hypothetical protein [Conexibacter sp. DBS9H8]|uniref:hypothetical protein n=1 Tax=Conexibacter sp. DBS9H8 TaxID=2937801 RepID=UPI00200E01E7|nr:hypothetical protein [Conexibacter sp. DBS9H8]
MDSWLEGLLGQALGEPSSLGPGWRAERRADGSVIHRPVLDGFGADRQALEDVRLAELARAAASVKPRRRLFGGAADPDRCPMP